MKWLLHQLGNLCYVALAIDALWGLFCVILLWRRVAQVRFRSEEAQDEFLDQVDARMSAGDWAGVQELCEGDSRVLPQLISLAVESRRLGYGKVRQMLPDRFRRDVMGEVEHRVSWINSVIKSAPMLGLLGTVIGMMEAFFDLSTTTNVDPTQLAGAISVALITTFLGLAIAIPLTLVMTSIHVRIRRMEELLGVGLTRFLESFKATLEGSATRGEVLHGRQPVA